MGLQRVTQLSDFHFQKWSTSKKKKKKKRRVGGLSLNYCSRRILPKRKLGRPKIAPGLDLVRKELRGTYLGIGHDFIILFKICIYFLIFGHAMQHAES